LKLFKSKNLALLEQLKQKTKEEFPAAMKFIRPGFDNRKFFYRIKSNPLKKFVMHCHHSISATKNRNFEV